MKGALVALTAAAALAAAAPATARTAAPSEALPAPFLWDFRPVAHHPELRDVYLTARCAAATTTVAVTVPARAVDATRTVLASVLAQARRGRFGFTWGLAPCRRGQRSALLDDVLRRLEARRLLSP